MAWVICEWDNQYGNYVDCLPDWKVFEYDFFVCALRSQEHEHLKKICSDNLEYFTGQHGESQTNTWLSVPLFIHLSM